MSDTTELPHIDTTDLQHALEHAADGSNVHTVNKVLFYLRYFTDHPEKRHGAAGHDRLSTLCTLARASIEDGNWNFVGQYMAGWF